MTPCSRHHSETRQCCRVFCEFTKQLRGPTFHQLVAYLVTTKGEDEIEIRGIAIPRNEINSPPQCLLPTTTSQNHHINQPGVPHIHCSSVRQIHRVLPLVTHHQLIVEQEKNHQGPITSKCSLNNTTFSRGITTIQEDPRNVCAFPLRGPPPN